MSRNRKNPSIAAVLANEPKRCQTCGSPYHEKCRSFECPACHEVGVNGHYDGREKCQAIAGSDA